MIKHRMTSFQKLNLSILFVHGYKENWRSSIRKFVEIQPCQFKTSDILPQDPKMSVIQNKSTSDGKALCYLPPSAAPSAKPNEPVPGDKLIRAASLKVKTKSLHWQCLQQRRVRGCLSARWQSAPASSHKNQIALIELEARVNQISLDTYHFKHLLNLIKMEILLEPASNKLLVVIDILLTTKLPSIGYTARESVVLGRRMDDPNITMEEYIRLEEEKARKRAIVFNDNLTSNETLSCEPMVSSLNDNEIDLRMSFEESNDEDYMDFENEYPAIVYNDALTSKSDFLTEPTLCPQHVDEFDLKDETSLSKYDEDEQSILYFNDLFPFNIIYPDDLKSDKDNDDNEINIIQSLGGNVNTQGSNKLLEASHDKINRIFNVEGFVMKLKVNIVAFNCLNNGMLLNLIKNLYVPFGILFDPKFFYKDGINLGQV
ncbi:hypothetical protein Tco_0400521 [Tanacetum coccineum]